MKQQALRYFGDFAKRCTDWRSRHRRVREADGQRKAWGVSPRLAIEI